MMVRGLERLVICSRRIFYGGKFMKKRFIELPKKNTVIAMMEEKPSIIKEIESVNKSYSFVLNKLEFMFGRKESGNPYFKSKAVAHDGDEFDIRIGRQIAEQKVDYKYHKSMVSQYNRYISLLENIITTLESLRNKHIGKKRKIENSMKKFV